MSEYEADFIVVGAGSAGAIVAERLSANGRSRVLLLESGGTDKHPFIAMPKGISKIIGDPKFTWTYDTEAHGDVPSEHWTKGRLLGGSSSINGMMYFRGQRQDYDDWAEAGAPGWNWSQISRVFDEMEGGSAGGRGTSGPLKVSLDESGDELSEAFIRAGQAMGVPRVANLNNPDQEGVGYAAATISGGRRMSTARAFLDDARSRPNLRVETGVDVERVLFDGTRAVGVACRVNGQRREYRTGGEVILSAGALNSPAILQRSGVGDGARLGSLGIAVVADRAQVGENLLEHRTVMMQYVLNKAIDENAAYRGLPLLANAIRYFAARSGPMAKAVCPVAGFVRTLPDLDRPDVQITMSPVVVKQLGGGRITTADQPSIRIFAYPCRPRSRGHVRIRSADDRQQPTIRLNPLSDPYDQAVTIRGFLFSRDWMRQAEIAQYVAAEDERIAQAVSNEDILALHRRQGQSTYHSCGTCRMGTDPDAVVDEKLRVRGVSRLRVVDASVMPTMPSANLNGPTMAVGWRAAELIRESYN